MTLGIITTKDISFYLLLSRKKKELEFRIKFLKHQPPTSASQNAESTNVSISSLESEMVSVDRQLEPLETRILSSGILVFQLHGKKITEYTEQINKHNMKQLTEALSVKDGELYDIIQKRGELLKENLSKKEDIAELTIVTNFIPRSVAEQIRNWVEGETSMDGMIDMREVHEDKQYKLLNILNRLGTECYIENETLFRGVPKKKEKTTVVWQSEVPRHVNGEKVWVPQEKANEFDNVMKELEQVSLKIQALTAKKQVVALTEEENKNYMDYQNKYLVLAAKRNAITKLSNT